MKPKVLSKKVQRVLHSLASLSLQPVAPKVLSSGVDVMMPRTLQPTEEADNSTGTYVTCDRCHVGV